MKLTMVKHICTTLLLIHTLSVTGQAFLEPQTNTLN
jgi:hypothetical protein